MKDPKVARARFDSAEADITALRHIEITDAASSFADLVDLTDFAVQLRYDVAIDTEPLDRRLTVEQIAQLWDAVRA